MNRRNFLGLFGGAIASAVVKPSLTAQRKTEKRREDTKKLVERHDSAWFSISPSALMTEGPVQRPGYKSTASM